MLYLDSYNLKWAPRLGNTYVQIEKYNNGTTGVFYKFSVLSIEWLSKIILQPEVQLPSVWPPASSRSGSRLPFLCPASRSCRRRRCWRGWALCRNWPKLDPGPACSQVWVESSRSWTWRSRRLHFKTIKSLQFSPEQQYLGNCNDGCTKSRGNMRLTYNHIG